jgi:hypothetical protein
LQATSTRCTPIETNFSRTSTTWPNETSVPRTGEGCGRILSWSRCGDMKPLPAIFAGCRRIWPTTTEIVSTKRRRFTAASLIGRQGQALSGHPPLRCQCRSRALASLRNRHQGPSIMGFEDEVEQSFGRPCRQCDCRSQAAVRTHLIHRPARDIIPPLGGSQVFWCLI